MTNEYGVKLDRNGYGPSLAQEEGCCHICKRTDRALQRHEVFHGPYRAKSKAFGCWVTLCDLCHADIHNGRRSEAELKQEIQSLAMQEYGWSVSDFRSHFGKNYLEGE